LLRVPNWVSTMAQRRKTVGDFVIGNTIGEGTFGKVRSGIHRLTGEKVAIKVLEKERIVERADVERVAREISILKKLRHPHVIQLYEIVETPRQLYLIMELASGGELFDYIVQSKRVKEQEACKFFHQILAGVEKIHQEGVVHRDLKPENLLLDEHHTIKIVDFGLSNQYMRGELLKTACGSPCYAAPEMIAGKHYDPLFCDIWSCGVILFALVAGYLPFEDTSTPKLYSKILNGQYQMPAFLSRSVKDLIRGILTTDPSLRFTLERIRDHPWYKQPDVILPQRPLRLSEGADFRSCEVIGCERCHTWLEREVPDPAILKQMAQIKTDSKVGFSHEYVTRCLQINKHNSATTTYYLLLNKYIKLRERNGTHRSSEGSQTYRASLINKPRPRQSHFATDSLFTAYGHLLRRERGAGDHTERDRPSPFLGRSGQATRHIRAQKHPAGARPVRPHQCHRLRLQLTLWLLLPARMSVPAQANSADHWAQCLSLDKAACADRSRAGSTVQDRRAFRLRIQPLIVFLSTTTNHDRSHRNWVFQPWETSDPHDIPLSRGTRRKQVSENNMVCHGFIC